MLLKSISDCCLVHEDHVEPSERVLELEHENEKLQRSLEALRRELQSQSPTRSARKSQPKALQALGVVSDSGNSLFRTLTNTPNPRDEKLVKTPGKNIRKFTARKWDLMDEDEMNAYENME